MKPPTMVSLVVPFYNEGACVDVFHDAVIPVLDLSPGHQFEIVCVDDGSTDDTVARLTRIAGSDSRYVVIELTRNFGKEAALTAGLDQAKGDVVIVLDADLQDPPELIPRMLDLWRAGAEVVLARRRDRLCDTWMKRISAHWFYRLHNAMADITMPADVGDCRLMDREVVDSLRLLPERQRFMKGLFCWVGYRTEILDYERKPRAWGSSKFAGWKLWNLALEGITSFSTAPLRIWTYVGLAGAFATMLYALIILGAKIFSGIDVPGYASILLSVLFFGSIQLISLGLIGEYVGRIYVETKQRPVYVIRRRQRRERHGPGTVPAATAGSEKPVLPRRAAAAYWRHRGSGAAG